MTAPTGTDPLDLLREVDPARRADGPHAAWAAETRAAIVAGDRRDRAPRRARRWAGAVVAGAGVAALAALMAVLLVAGGGDDRAPDGATAASLVVVGAPVGPEALEETVAVVRARVDALGLEGVTVTADPDGQALRVEGTVDEADLRALAAPGRLTIRAPDRPGARPLHEGDLADARADGDALTLGFTDEGARAFRDLTRQIAQDGALMGRPQAMEVLVDGRTIAEPVVDHEAYPTGIDGRNGLVVPAGTAGDARRLAAVLGSGPLPVALAAVDPPVRGTVTVIVADDATPADVERMGDAFRQRVAAGDLVSAEFVSEEEALDRLRARLQNPSILDELPSNPMPASYEVVPAPGADRAALAAAVRALPGVDRVVVAR
ncbi:MAG: permease-like cell division protein FtsX [Thermoleophilia bacterium]